MSEGKFWRIYFHLVGHLLHGSPPSLQTTPQGATGPDRSQRSVQMSPSGMSAWEDVVAPSPVPSAGRSVPNAQTPPVKDDLDEYLKVWLRMALSA
jgi:hypothetical protein